jgi:hypothetical protein
MDGTTKFEATPLVVDGVMYTVKPPTPSYEVVALDAASGRIIGLFLHSRRIASLLWPQQQGLAIQGDRLYLPPSTRISFHWMRKQARKCLTLKSNPEYGPAGDYSFTVTPLVVGIK